jgi:hypothetical protein
MISLQHTGEKLTIKRARGEKAFYLMKVVKERGRQTENVFFVSRKKREKR